MDNLNNIPSVGNWGDAASKLNDNFNKVKQAVTTIENTSKNNKGYFSSLSALNTAFPSPKTGQTAYVYSEASSTKYYIYNAFNGAWASSTVEAPSVGVDISEYTKTGGSTKTTKDVEDDLAQLAGDTNAQSIPLEQGTLNNSTGQNVVSATRVRTPFLSYDIYSKLNVDEGYYFLHLILYDKNRNYLKSLSATLDSNSRSVILPLGETASYFRAVISKSNNSTLLPDEDMGFRLDGIKYGFEESKHIFSYLSGYDTYATVDESNNIISFPGLVIVNGRGRTSFGNVSCSIIPVNHYGQPVETSTSALIANKNTLVVQSVSMDEYRLNRDKTEWLLFGILKRNTASTVNVGRVTNVAGSFTVKYSRQNARLNNYILNSFNGTFDNIGIKQNGRTISIKKQGFTLIYNGVSYNIAGNEDIELDRVTEQTRTYIYIDTSKLNDSGTTYWNSTDVFVTNISTVNLQHMILFASYYYDSIQEAGIIATIVNKQRIAGKSDKRYTIKQVYNGLSGENYPVKVYVRQNRIEFPRAMVVFDDSTGTHVFSGSEKNIPLLPTNWSGVAQDTSNGVILFNPDTLELKNIAYRLARNVPDGETWWRIANLKSIANEMAYLACTFEWVVVDGRDGALIAQRNRDCESAVDSIIDRRYDINTGLTVKRFTFIHETDIHGDKVRHGNIIDYLNYKRYIDALITTGDILYGDFTDDFNFFQATKEKVTQDILPVLGNHDVGNSTLKSICGTDSECYERFIQPFESYGLVTNGKNYWYKDYNKYKIRIIAIYEYDNEDTDPNDSTKYRLRRGEKVFQQSQINWFINTLNDTPLDYHVIILTHLSPYGDYSECEWVDDWTDSTSRYKTGVVTASYVDGNPIGDIVNAWIKGISINQSYGFLREAAYLEPIMVNHDFSTRGAGVFIGYFHGHYHRDGLCTLKNYPEQHAVRAVASSANTSVVHNTDLNRTIYTKSEDSFNVVSVDVTDRVVYIVRVGANTTKFLEDRKMIKYTY